MVSRELRPQEISIPGMLALLWNQDSPVNEGRNMWPGLCDGVENAEPGAILGGRILARW